MTSLGRNEEDRGIMVMKVNKFCLLLCRSYIFICTCKEWPWWVVPLLLLLLLSCSHSKRIRHIVHAIGVSSQVPRSDTLTSFSSCISCTKRERWKSNSECTLHQNGSEQDFHKFPSAVPVPGRCHRGEMMAPEALVQFTVSLSTEDEEHYTLHSLSPPDGYCQCKHISQLFSQSLSGGDGLGGRMRCNSQGDNKISWEQFRIYSYNRNGI